MIGGESMPSARRRPDGAPLVGDPPPDRRLVTPSGMNPANSMSFAAGQWVGRFEAAEVEPISAGGALESPGMSPPAPRRAAPENADLARSGVAAEDGSSPPARRGLPAPTDRTEPSPSLWVPDRGNEQQPAESPDGPGEEAGRELEDLQRFVANSLDRTLPALNAELDRIAARFAELPTPLTVRSGPADEQPMPTSEPSGPQ